MATADTTAAALRVPPFPVAMLAGSSPQFPGPYRFSLEQFERMIETDILGEHDRVELLDGEIVEKMVIGDKHSLCVGLLTNLFPALLAGRAYVWPQNPLVVGANRPEPDFTLLKPRADRYRSDRPTAADALLLIEVAESSLPGDRKMPIYARGGIADYWIINLTDCVLEVHRRPQPDGTYAEVRTLQPHESLAPLAFADVTISVADLLP